MASRWSTIVPGALALGLACLATALGCKADTGGFRIEIDHYPEIIQADEPPVPVEIRVIKGYEDHLPIRLWFPNYPVTVEFRADPECTDLASFDCGDTERDGFIASRLVHEAQVEDDVITVDFLRCDAPGLAPGTAFTVDLRVVVVDEDGLESNSIDVPFTCTAP